MNDSHLTYSNLQLHVITDEDSIGFIILTPGFQISGGGLPSKFQFAQLHFHWGSNDFHGSEHRIDGVRFSHLTFRLLMMALNGRLIKFV